MRLRRLVALLALVSAMAALVAACGSSDSATGSSGDTEGASAETTAAAGEEQTGTGGGGKIGWIVPLPDPWAKNMTKAIEIKAEQLGMTVKTLEANYDTNLQLQSLDSMLQSGEDAILTIPIDVESLQPGIDRATKAGVPFLEVLGYELGSQRDISLDVIANDEEVAREIGELAAEEAKGDCKAGIMSGPPGVTILELRAKGLRAGLEAGGCEILDEQPNVEGSPEKATEIARSWETRFGGEMTVVTGTDDTNAEGTLVAKRGDFQPIVTGFNGEDSIRPLIESGEILASGQQPVVQMGAVLAYAASKLINGEEVPRQPVLPGTMLTAETVGETQSEAELLSAPLEVEFVKEGGRWVAEVSLPE